jgi:hypothetical protein
MKFVIARTGELEKIEEMIADVIKIEFWKE